LRLTEALAEEEKAKFVTGIAMGTAGTDWTAEKLLPAGNASETEFRPLNPVATRYSGFSWGGLGSI
jgi:hypothetical protein